MVGHPEDQSRRDVDLRRFRYHTGAEPTRLAVDEPCPPLFRDIGLDGMVRFLRRDLGRLCGPLSPITYMRSADYVEPYTDYGKIGRVMLLSPQKICPWHSGVETVFIGPREIAIDYESMIFIPDELPLNVAADRLSDVRTLPEAIDVMGNRCYQDAKDETSFRLYNLQRAHAKSEIYAAPLRKRFQSRCSDERDEAREWMLRAGLTESDLCTAWHHLPDQRREFVSHALQELGEAIQ